MRQGLLAALVVPLLASLGWSADETYSLSEQFPVGYHYRVSCRVEVKGSLTAPAAKGKTAKRLNIAGSAAIDYDEKILALDKQGNVTRTVRRCKKLDFKRTLADQPQAVSLRPGIKNLVILRKKSQEVPFSPDGPLLWAEIDAVRTDIFTPALGGLLPGKAVRVGDKWNASTVAVQELTDLEKIDQGNLLCRLEKVVSKGKMRWAKVIFSGTIKGVSEDGPGTHILRGHYFFDLGSKHLNYLLLQGTNTLTGMDGKEAGRIEGRCVLHRDATVKPTDLSSTSLKGVKLEPDEQNTLLLFDDPDLGLKFVYPRRWHIASVGKQQVALDAEGGAGLLMTVDPPSSVPTAAQFLTESRGWLVKQKAKVTKTVQPTRIRATLPLDTFALEAELGKNKFWMDYYVLRQAGGGVTVAARLPTRDLASLRKDVATIARSMAVTKRIGK